MDEIWFWQTVVSPHMAALASACAAAGHRVTYVAQASMTEDRIRQGWSEPDVPGVALRIAETAGAMRRAADEAPDAAVHVCQGLRGNGLVGVAQRRLRWRRARQWVVMEVVADAGLAGRLKRLAYRLLFLRMRPGLEGVLAIGATTRDWIVARGMPAARVFPFAYFLPPDPEQGASACLATDVARDAVRILFAGRLIPLKRLDLLIEALAALPAWAQGSFQLEVVGDGPQSGALRALAARRLGDRVEWRGRLPMAQVRQRMHAADCLVLPSDYDGWGAVVSEALMAGVPVICSDACGAAGAVRASGVGAVFPAGRRADLSALLAGVIQAGPPALPARRALADWACCLGAAAGADYLARLLDHASGRGPRPSPPWLTAADRHGGVSTCVV